MAITGTLSGSWSAFRNANHGPWLMPNGNLYAVTVGSGVINAVKSTTDGDTWSVAATLTLASATGCAAYPNGAILHVIGWTTSGLAYERFDSATDTWSSLAVGTSTNTTALGVVQAAIAARSTGAVAVIEPDGTDRIMGTDYRRATLDTYIGSTWTSGVADLGSASEEAHHDPVGACRGASDRIHIFYTGLASGTRTLRHRTWTSGGTLVAEQTVATIQNSNYPVGQPWSDGTSVMIPYVDTGGVLRVAYATSADSPSWSTAAVSGAGNAPETASANPGAVAHDGSDWHIIWPTDAQTAILRDTSSTGATWGTDTTEASGLTTVRGVSAAYASIGSGGLAILYDDNGTVSYRGPDAGAGGATAATTATSPTLTEQAVTAAAGTSASATADAPTLTGQSVTAGTGAAATTTATAPSLTARGVTAAAGAGASTTADTPTLAGQALTAGAGSAATTTATTPTLTGRTATATAGATAATTADAPTLTAQGATASAGTTATTVADAPSLLGQSVVASAGAHAVTTPDTPTLTEQGVTASAGASASTTATSPSLTGQSVTASAATASTAATSADTLTIATQTVTATAGATAAPTADSPVLAGQTATAGAGVTATTSTGTMTLAAQTVTGTAGATAATTAASLTSTGATVTGTVAGGAVTATTSPHAITLTGFTISATGEISIRQLTDAYQWIARRPALRAAVTAGPPRRVEHWDTPPELTKPPMRRK